MQLLDRMVLYQKKHPQIYCTEAIFGKFNPRLLELNLYELFGPPNIPRKARRYEKRGSSAIWIDEKEFATPTPTAAGK